MSNLLMEEVEYRVTRTPFGTWRRYLYPTGARFAEFRSHTKLLGLPLLHYTCGICPSTGRRIVARGVIAVGRLACGILAIGHASLGVIAVGQLAVGVLFGLGQACCGVGALGQLALGLQFGVGQIATGRFVIAQIGLGQYVLAQVGAGRHVWSTTRTDPEAVEFFKNLFQSLFGG